MRKKEYLGDSVYAEYNTLGHIVLTTENALPTDPSNVIVLEPETLRALIEFSSWHIKARRQDKEGKKNLNIKENSGLDIA